MSVVAGQGLYQLDFVIGRGSGGLVRIALGIEYAGSGFEGWQTQPHGRTVQDAMQRALGIIAGHPVELVCAGRTDTGVHASVQVAHFDAKNDRPMTAWVRGVNAHLPAGVVVNWAHEVDERFHARFSARARRPGSHGVSAVQAPSPA